MKLKRPVGKQFKVSSPFGNRLLEGKLALHNGIDFAVPVGTPVQAAVDGVVVRAGWENAAEPKLGYGLRVMQRFEDDGVFYFCWYGHLNEPKVKEGDRILKGQVVGLSGNTGHSTGPHLHFGVRRADTGEYQDPIFEPEAVA